MSLRIVRGPPVEWSEKDLGSMLAARATTHGDHPGFLVREGGAYATWTWREVAARAAEVAAGLVSLGIRHGETVAILADTSPEWSLADFGIMSAGGATVTIYPTLPADQVLELLRDSGAVAVFVDSPDQQRKLASILAQAGAVRHVVVMGEPAPDLDASAAKRAVPFEELRAQGRAALAADPRLVEARLAAIEPTDLSTIIYTSGTTGIPKGAALTHENWLCAAASMRKVFELDQYPLDERRTIAFLPLAHVLSRLMVITFTMVPGTVAFSSPRTMAKDVHEVRPNAIVCVPRIWERMHQQIHKVVAEQPAARRKVFAQAEKTAIEHGHATANGGKPSLGLRARHAAFEALVYRKLREKLGFGAMFGAMSTAAAIRPDLLAFYRGIGIDIVELWGMTEMAGPGVTNTRTRYKPGSVGWPIPGLDVALDDEGEICVSGRNVFDGYHNRPDENAASFFDADGRRWFRTGDVGRFDDDGALRIVDRKKEIEVLDTGKKIAPIAVEERLKGVSRFVAEACLVATGRKFAGALVQPNYDVLVEWAKDRNLPFDASRVVVKPDPTGNPMTYAVGEDLLAHPDVRGLFAQEVERCNAHSADFERIRVFHLVPHAFTIDRDELTMTLKKKRRVIHANYRDAIERMFARNG